jgi:hypothetical protein
MKNFLYSVFVLKKDDFKAEREKLNQKMKIKSSNYSSELLKTIHFN